ncbi:MAG: sulfite exporter TauE/SafE family protein [Bacteroidia bacterium]|nr:sulfite exporter TauE/SafE family protein [Bacteroidia bacterium]
MEIYDYLIIAILGSFGAFLSGLLGVGGGIIFIPVLDHFLKKCGMHDDMLVKGILANSLFTIIFSGSVSSYKQYKMGNFFPKQIWQTALPGVFTAILLTYLIKSGNWYNKGTFNYVFAGMLLVIMIRMFLKGKTTPGTWPEPTARQFGTTGFFTGIITALSGLGGGVVMTPVFTDVLKIPIKKASSISNGVIPLFAIAIGIYNLGDTPPYKISEWQVGYIVFPVILPMILAAFIFAPLGVKIAQQTTQSIIRLIFAMMVGLVLIKVLYEIFAK